MSAVKDVAYHTAQLEKRDAAMRPVLQDGYLANRDRANELLENLREVGIHYTHRDVISRLIDDCYSAGVSDGMKAIHAGNKAEAE